MKNIFIFQLITIVITGCALLDMKKENQALRDSLVLKENQLDEVKKQHLLLFEKEKHLVNDLETKKMTLGQLDYELDELIKENKQLASLKKEHQKSTKEAEQSIRKLKESKMRIAELERQDAMLSKKEIEIQALRNEIRQYLKIGLKAKYRPGAK